MHPQRHEGGRKRVQSPSPAVPDPQCVPGSYLRVSRQSRTRSFGTVLPSADTSHRKEGGGWHQKPWVWAPGEPRASHPSVSVTWGGAQECQAGGCSAPLQAAATNGAMEPLPALPRASSSRSQADPGQGHSSLQSWTPLSQMVGFWRGMHWAEGLFLEAGRLP